jgi:hypothetical protein
VSASSSSKKTAYETATLYRPVGPAELALIEASGWKAFPPRLPEQPIFYPVLNVEYARQIARDWNVRESGAGFVMRFEIDAAYVARFAVQTVGAAVHQELWVPAEELDTFNAHIVGTIEMIEAFR